MAGLVGCVAWRTWANGSTTWLTRRRSRASIWRSSSPPIVSSTYRPTPGCLSRSDSPSSACGAFFGMTLNDQLRRNKASGRSSHGPIPRLGCGRLWCCDGLWLVVLRLPAPGLAVGVLRRSTASCSSLRSSSWPRSSGTATCGRSISLPRSRRGDPAVMTAAQPSVVIAHPSSDLYGSDRVMLETVAAMADGDWSVHVVLPGPGPLVEEVRARGGEVTFTPSPVLRKAALRPRGFAHLMAAGAAGVVPGLRLLRSTDARVVYVSTLTIPLWIYCPDCSVAR